MFNRFKQQLSRSFTSTRLNRAAGMLLRRSPQADGSVGISQAKRILVLKPDGIGDVILVTGFLRSLRRQCPQAHITVAVREMAREIVAYPGFCDEIMLWKEEWCGMSLPLKSAWNLIRSAREKWQNNQPDWVLIPRSGWDHANAAMYAWWSGSANVCAHEFFCNDRGMSRQGFVNHVLPTPEMVHETEFHRRMLQYLRLEALITPQLELPLAVRQKAHEFLTSTAANQKNIALGVGASHDSKRWPAANFKKLISSLTQTWPDATVYLIGGREDTSIARSLLEDATGSIIDTTGKLSILETAALLSHCQVYVGNNSGPIHLAGAAGCAVVEVSKHPVGAKVEHECAPARFGPVAQWTCILQPAAQAPECMAGCDKAQAHCITDISAERVMQAISNAFATAPIRGEVDDVRFQTIR